MNKKKKCLQNRLNNNHVMKKIEKIQFKNMSKKSKNNKMPLRKFKVKIKIYMILKENQKVIKKKNNNKSTCSNMNLN